MYAHVLDLCGTSAKNVQLNEWGCTMRGNKEIPLATLFKNTTIIMRNPLPEYVERVTCIICYSILDSVANGISLLPQFFARCIPSLHPHSFS